MKFYPYKKGGRAKKDLAMLKGKAQQVLWYFVNGSLEF